MSLFDRLASVPGTPPPSLAPRGLAETTRTYAGPPELEAQLPGTQDEEAARLAERAAEQAEQAVERAVASVAALRQPYPTSFDHTALWLRGSVEALRARLETNDPHARLASVRRLAAEVEQAAEALLVATRGISQRMARMNGGPA